MISVFKGKRRGIGGGGNENFMKLEFGFRDILHFFHGAKLAVFMAIALHSDENGLSFPSYDALEVETGYGRDTIARAIKELCEMRISGKRILTKYRKRDEHGHFIGTNQYLIFPTDDEIAENEPQNEEMVVGKANCGKCSLKEEPLSKEEPLIQGSQKNQKPQEDDQDMANDDFPHADVEAAEQPQEPTPEQMFDSPYKTRIAKALSNSQPYKDWSGLNVLNVDHFPEDVRPTVARICQLWKLTPPAKSAKKGGQFAYWLSEARELVNYCGEFGVKVIEAIHEEHREYMKSHGGIPPFAVSSPKSLINSANRKAGELRQRSVIGSDEQTASGGFWI